MISPMKTCRTCGKEYKACRSAKTAAGVFRWQDVACSPECGAVYLAKITESRSVKDQNDERPVKKTKKRTVVDQEENRNVSVDVFGDCATDPNACVFQPLDVVNETDN